ncbi:MAG: DinB family protein [Flavobacteriaceae bacterium]|nr:DinB family protein [Flavobacteriaceae bacterium]
MLYLESNEYASFYKPYIEILLNNDHDIIENLRISGVKFEQLLSNLDTNKQLYQYAEGKWMIKELIQHMIDTERVFSYRALRFARKDQIDLAGFDENAYVEYSKANKRNYQDLLDEFIALRKTTIFLYQSFSKQTMLNKGMASGSLMSVGALGYITSGHLLHHLEVIRNRYL